MKKIFLIIFLGILILIPLISLAAGLVPCGGTGEPVCEFCHFFVMFKNIVDFILFKIVPALAALLIAIGGFMYIIAYTGAAGGGPEMMNRAKSLFMSVVWGLLICYGSWLIVSMFFTFIGVADWTKLSPDVKGWFIIDCQ